MSYHDAYVQAICGGEKGWFASCPSCGCDGFPDRETFVDAQEDADLHRERYRDAPIGPVAEPSSGDRR